MEKHSLQDLALLGGPKIFREPVYVGRPNSVNQAAFFAKVKDALDRKRLTNNGPYVQELEEKIANYIGVEHCVAVCNGTAGLQIAIRAAGMSGEVIVPSFTYVATPHALLANNITPVFCDIAPDTYNLHPPQVARLISNHTTGILGVHLWGLPCDVRGLTELADEHQIKLIFDAAHAFGCTYRGTPIGNFGDMEVFSFHATKFFNTIEGGAIVTNNNEYALKARQIRNFGFSEAGKSVSYGTNAKMDEISAAMGLTMFENLEALVRRNQRNYQLYRRLLANIPGLRLIHFPEEEKNNYQFIVLEIEPGPTSLSRDELVSVLESENIAARRYFYPGSHRLQPYAELFRDQHLDLPITEQMCARLMILPTGDSIAEDDIRKISLFIRLVIQHAREIKELLHRKSASAILPQQ